MATVTLAALIFFVVNAREPDYAVALTGLQQEDAAEIVVWLKEADIPYQLNDRGDAILVPSTRVHEARLGLAAEGLPKGGKVGFEIFNQPNLGISEQSQRVNYQRALEGELCRTINHLDDVQWSRVHLVMPQPSIYSRESRDPTASIVLGLKTGRSVGAAQVRGIVHLVTTAVEGLKPENVTTIDTEGNILSGAGGDSSHGITYQGADQLEVQQSYERAVERRLLDMLDSVLGPGRAAIKVSATFDWDRTERESESYSPITGTGAVRSSREVLETASGNTSSIAGVPGLPTYQQVVTGTSPSQSELRDVTTNYELSRTVERITKATGELKSLSAAVVVDSEALEDPSHLEEITSLVFSAAGMDRERGDNITVTSLPFKSGISEADIQAVEEATSQDRTMTMIRTAAMVLGPLLLLLILRLMLRRSAGQAGVRVLPPASRRLRAARSAEGEPLALPSLPEGNRRQAMLGNQMMALARNDASTLSQLIDTWVEEDKRQ